MDNIDKTYFDMLKESQNKQIIKKQKRLEKLEKLLKDNKNQFGHRMYNSNKENYQKEILQLKKQLNNLKMGHTGQQIPEHFKQPISKINELLKRSVTYINKLKQLEYQMESYKNTLIKISKQTNLRCSQMDRTIQKISDFKKWFNK